jgi:hypothetical protein
VRIGLEVNQHVANIRESREQPILDQMTDAVTLRHSFQGGNLDVDVDQVF